MDRPAERTLIVVVMVALAFAIWTVIPLGWLWIGSQVANSRGDAPGQATLLPYAVVGVGILVSVVLDAMLLGRLARRHERLLGRAAQGDRRPSWLRSLRGESHAQLLRRPAAMVENVMVLSVMLAGVAWVGWFLFSAGSSLPGG